LPHEADLLEGIEGFCQENNITLGVFTAIGAVKSARLAYYDQESREYRGFAVDEPMEMVSCTGNISLRDGQPIVHAHLALSDGEGRTISGHLMPGTPIFACEIFIQELLGEPLVRRHDEETGLPLWWRGSTHLWLVGVVECAGLIERGEDVLLYQALR